MREPVGIADDELFERVARVQIARPELGLHAHGAGLDGRSALRGGRFAGLFDHDELQVERRAERFGQGLDDLRFQAVFDPVAGEIVLDRQQQLVSV